MSFFDIFKSHGHSGSSKGGGNSSSRRSGSSRGTGSSYVASSYASHVKHESERQHKYEQIKRDGFDLDGAMKRWAQEDD